MQPDVVDLKDVPLPVDEPRALPLARGVVPLPPAHVELHARPRREGDVDPVGLLHPAAVVLVVVDEAPGGHPGQLEPDHVGLVLP